MREALGDRMTATCYTYIDLKDIKPAVNEFERYLLLP